jgi:hypothetical protein
LKNPVKGKTTVREDLTGRMGFGEAKIRTLIINKHENRFVAVDWNDDGVPGWDLLG